MRHEAEEVGFAEDEAADVFLGAHVGDGRAVLEQTDFAEEAAGIETGENFFAAAHDDAALVHDVELMAVLALGDDGFVLVVRNDGRNLREAGDGLRVPAVAEGQAAEERNLVDEIVGERNAEPGDDALLEFFERKNQCDDRSERADLGLGTSGVEDAVGAEDIALAWRQVTK